MINVFNSNQLISQSTSELKAELLERVKGRDTDSLSTKVQYYKNILTPYIEELTQRNPYPIVVEQIPIVLGVWTPLWSTIPFHDTLPGRDREQSYQIFHDDSYYANIARYTPGQNTFWQKLSAKLPAIDLMVMQKYAVRDNKWYIQNVGIEQAFRNREVPLAIEDAESWFSSVVGNKFQSAQEELPQALDLQLDRKTVKKLEKTYLATPQLEHLYVDRDLRIVKTQREASQRPSYTIAIRRQ
ncbi:PAP/fibrillin family protein [Gloeocapsa sp. BRSZ]